MDHNFAADLNEYILYNWNFRAVNLIVTKTLITMEQKRKTLKTVEATEQKPKAEPYSGEGMSPPGFLSPTIEPPGMLTIDI